MWFAVAWLGAGCAVYTSGIGREAAADVRAAYLYGRFYMNAVPAGDADFGTKQSMGLVIRCQNGSEYTFGAIYTRDIQVLEIKPSRCWLVEAVLADQNRVVRKRLAVDPSLQRPLEFTAGRAHYVGDFFAKGDFWVDHRHRMTRNWQWAMSPADDRYESTTAEMKQTFPKVASLPTVDMRLIPAPERKRGNGIVAAADEPPMSPERVAHVAPFIKRNYGSPAECEAACPAGECLPYRSEAGPAMACVIHCDRDGDCPEGLACNCPNSEKSAGANCRPIATAPRDPMKRICLSVETAGQRR
jgi:hypothetical protein